MLLWLKDSTTPPATPAPEVRVLETDGEWGVVESPRPFPIGATLIAIDPAAAPESGEYRLKVRGAKRTPNGFRIEGRWVSLEKHQRERLLENVAVQRRS